MAFSWRVRGIVCAAIALPTIAISIALAATDLLPEDRSSLSFQWQEKGILITAVGVAAVPDDLTEYAQAKIAAIRAAEVDAYRNIAFLLGPVIILS